MTILMGYPHGAGENRELPWGICARVTLFKSNFIGFNLHNLRYMSPVLQFVSLFPSNSCLLSAIRHIFTINLIILPKTYIYNILYTD